MKKIFVMLLTMLLLTGCSYFFKGEMLRRSKPPTEKETYEFIRETLGIGDAKILQSYNVIEDETPDDGRDYHGVDGLYVVESPSRGVTFEVRRMWDYDTLFSSGYHYKWNTNYDRTVLEDYMKTHPLPSGVIYDINKGYTSTYDSLDGHAPMIYFECEDEADFERYVDLLDPWLKAWYDYEHEYMTNDRGLAARVVFKQVPSAGYDHGMLGDAQLGHNKGNATAETFKKAMRESYESRRKLDKTN